MAKERERIDDQGSKTTPGVGTDVFIRKKAPGAHVGEGYVVDIYENGVKTDSFEMKGKKETTELIRKFKEKYKTDRAFQNEVQVHITYKTKEERGEEAMTHLDSTLLKQASKIQDLLQRLFYPDEPIKYRVAQEGEEGLAEVSSIPEAPMPGDTTDNKEKVKQYVISEINKKFTAFVKEKHTAGVERQDEIFNPLRKWYGKLAKKIKEWNRMSSGALSKEDIDDIVNATKKVLLSKNTELIREKTGVEVDQAVADLMFEIGSKSIGKKGDAEKGGELGGNPEESKKAASVETSPNSIEDKLAEFEKKVRTVGSTTTMKEIAKELEVDGDDALSKMKKAISEKKDLNEAQSAIKRWVNEELESKKDAIEEYSTSFWRYATEFKGTANLEDVFGEWLEKQAYSNITVEDIQNTWDKINLDIENAFGRSDKKALQADESYGDFIIEVLGVKPIEGYFYAEIHPNNIILRPNLISTGVNFNIVKDIASKYAYIPSEEEIPNYVAKALEEVGNKENALKFALELIGYLDNEKRNMIITTYLRDSKGGNVIDTKEYRYDVIVADNFIQPSATTEYGTT